jgi:hypothetical protein
MRDLNGVWITAFLDDLTLRFIIVREQGVLCVTFDSMQLLLKSCKAAFSFFMGLGCVICFTGVGEWHQFWQEHRIPRTWQLGAAGIITHSELCIIENLQLHQIL